MQQRRQSWWSQPSAGKRWMAAWGPPEDAAAPLAAPSWLMPPVLCQVGIACPCIPMRLAVRSLYHCNTEKGLLKLRCGYTGPTSAKSGQREPEEQQVEEFKAPTSARRIKTQQCDAQSVRVSETGGNWLPGADSLCVMANPNIIILHHEHAVTSWERGKDYVDLSWRCRSWARRCGH